MQNIFVLISCPSLGTQTQNCCFHLLFIIIQHSCCWNREVAENSLLLLKNIASSTVIITDTSICWALSSLQTCFVVSKKALKSPITCLRAWNWGITHLTMDISAVAIHKNDCQSLQISVEERNNSWFWCEGNSQLNTENH